MPYPSISVLAHHLETLAIVAMFSCCFYVWARGTYWTFTGK